MDENVAAIIENAKAGQYAAVVAIGRAGDDNLFVISGRIRAMGGGHLPWLGLGGLTLRYGDGTPSARVKHIALTDDSVELVKLTEQFTAQAMIRTAVMSAGARKQEPESQSRSEVAEILNNLRSGDEVSVEIKTVSNGSMFISGTVKRGSTAIQVGSFGIASKGSMSGRFNPTGRLIGISVLEKKQPNYGSVIMYQGTAYQRWEDPDGTGGADQRDGWYACGEDAKHPWSEVAEWNFTVLHEER